MKNIPFIIIILIVLACNCPKPEETSKKQDEAKTSQTEKETQKTAEANKTDNENKVTMENFKKLKNGMSYKQVVEILGKEGELLSENEVAGTKTEMYQWKAGMMSNMNAMFQNDKLMSKAQFGLE